MACCRSSCGATPTFASQPKNKRLVELTGNTLDELQDILDSFKVGLGPSTRLRKTSPDNETMVSGSLYVSIALRGRSRAVHPYKHSGSEFRSLVPADILHMSLMNKNSSVERRTASVEDVWALDKHLRYPFELGSRSAAVLGGRSAVGSRYGCRPSRGRMRNGVAALACT